MSYVLFQPPAFGLDIGERSLKLVELGKRINWRGKPAEEFYVRAWDETAVPEGYLEGGVIKEEEKLTKIIEKLCRTPRGRKLSTKQVVACLPEAKSFLKTISLPEMNDISLLNRSVNDEPPTFILDAAQRFFPVSLEENYLDWQIVGPGKFLLGMAPRQIADQYTKILEKAGLTPVVLEIETAAICRSLIKEEDFSRESAIVLDCGATRSNLIVFSAGGILFSLGLPFSGNRVTEAISHLLQISWEEAEKAKIACGLDDIKCKGALREILSDMTRELVAKIKEAISFTKDNVLNQRINSIILAGGGANLLNLDKILSQMLKIKVRKGNPWVNILDVGAVPPLLAGKSTTFCTALGLALRGWQAF